MSKQTVISSAFVASGYYVTGNSLWLIQLSHSGHKARYTRYESYSNHVSFHRGEWQEIRFTMRDNRPFIRTDKGRMHLDNFIRATKETVTELINSLGTEKQF